MHKTRQPKKENPERYGSHSTPKHIREALNRKLRRILRAGIRHTQAGYGKAVVNHVRIRKDNQKEKHNLFVHTKTRFAQHYSMILTQCVYELMIVMINSERYDFLEDGNNGTQIYRLAIRSNDTMCDVVAVFDPKINTIVTVLPRDYQAV